MDEEKKPLTPEEQEALDKQIKEDEAKEKAQVRKEILEEKAKEKEEAKKRKEEEEAKAKRIKEAQEKDKAGKPLDEKESAALDAGKQLSKEEKKVRDRKESREILKRSTIVVVDVADYSARIDPADLHGTSRRIAAIKLMFTELGVDKYVAKVEFKGTDCFVFEK